MSLGKSKNKSSSTSQSALDPTASAAQLGNVASADAMKSGYTPYSGQTLASFNPTQTGAQQGLLAFGNGNVGGGILDRAVSTAQGAAGYQPQQVSAGQLSATDLSPYMNPYQSQVIDSTLSQYDRANQIDMNNARGRASQAGAFGGSGSALLQSQAQEANGRTLAQTLAGLNSANFGQAQSAAQYDIGNRFSADQANQSAGLSGNAQALQASGVLSGLSDQQRAQALQSLGILSGVGDAQQSQEQRALDAQHQAYLDELNQRLGLQANSNQAYGILGNPVLNSSTSKASGYSISASAPQPK